MKKQNTLSWESFSYKWIFCFVLIILFNVFGVSGQTPQSSSLSAPDNVQKNNSKNATTRLRSKLLRWSDSLQRQTIIILPDSVLKQNFVGLGRKKSRERLKSISADVKSNSSFTALQDKVKNVSSSLNPSLLSGMIERQASILNPQEILDGVKKNDLLKNLPDSSLYQRFKSASLNGEKKQTIEQVKGAFGTVHKTSASANLVVSDEFRYKPSPLSGLPVASATRGLPRFVNIVTINGTLQAFGVPLNLDLSTHQFSVPRANSFSNPLMRFGFDPELYEKMLKNEMQRYAELKKNALGGLDLGNYTGAMLTSQLIDKHSKLSGDMALQKYIQDPKVAGKLLMLDQEHAAADILEYLKQASAVDLAELNGLGNTADPKNLMQLKTQALNAVALNTQAFADLSSNKALAYFINDPYHRKEFSGFTEEKITRTLTEIVQQENGNNAAQAKTTIRLLAHQIVLQGIATDYRYEDLLQEQELVLKADSAAVAANDVDKIIGLLTLNNSQSPAVSLGLLESKASDAAAALQRLKTDLQRNGFNVSQLLEMQQLMGSASAASGLTELQNRYFQKTPAGFLQQLTYVLSGFKAGSFGANIPGSTHNEDMFISGANLKLKSRAIPITIGYGAQNDIKGLKDEQFQSTVFTEPRKIGYLTTELKERWGGSLKISFIGAFNQQTSNSIYSSPMISSNNVALTLSKYMPMGKLGNAIIDISKSTTIYPNNFVAGSEAVLNRKGGIIAEPFYQSLSLGINHQLEVESAGMTNEVYFNYAGTGYQNPGNNGFGGAETRFGGKVRKSAYNNRILLELRSDFRNRPISYINSDKWQSFQLQFNVRYKASKKVSMDVQYSTNTTSKKVGQVSQSAFGLQKLQFNGNANYKIGTNYSNSHLSIAGQNISNGYLAQSGGKLLMLNYSHILLVKKQTFTLNMLVNKELSAYQLLGDLLSTDVAWQFPAGKSLRLTSGVTYLNNKGLAHQAGVKEGLQWTTGRFDISSTIDLRKNLITPRYADLYSAVQADMTISYHFNN